MSDDLPAEKAALSNEFEALLASFVGLMGWAALFEACQRLAETRREGRVAGVLEAAAAFIRQEG